MSLAKTAKKSIQTVATILVLVGVMICLGLFMVVEIAKALLS